jgi:hypothetical protein
LPQEDVGGNVGVNHTQKVSRKAVADVATLFGGVGASCFYSKEVAK